MRDPTRCDLPVYFATALTYLFSKVTHLNIGTEGVDRDREGRRGGRIIKALSAWAQFKLNPLLPKKGKGWRRMETSRKQDKRIKEHKINS